MLGMLRWGNEGSPQEGEKQVLHQDLIRPLENGATSEECEEQVVFRNGKRLGDWIWREGSMKVCS